MMLTKAQERCLSYARKVRVVSAWPADISDATIRACRKAGWLDAYELTGMMVGGQRFAPGPKERDELTPTGRAALDEKP